MGKVNVVRAQLKLMVKSFVPALCLSDQTENTNITTVEGIGQVGGMDVMQQAFVDEGATQCGYCTPGNYRFCESFYKQHRSYPNR